MLAGSATIMTRQTHAAADIASLFVRKQSGIQDAWRILFNLQCREKKVLSFVHMGNIAASLLEVFYKYFSIGMSTLSLATHAKHVNTVMILYRSIGLKRLQGYCVVFQAIKKANCWQMHCTCAVDF